MIFSRLILQQIRRDIALDAVGEVGVLFLFAKILEILAVFASRFAFRAVAGNLVSRLLYPGGENRLEMRALFLARDDRDLDLLETGGFEKLVQLHFAKAKPVIGVKFAGAFETVAEQIEDHNAATLSQNPMGAEDGALGMDGVMQGLAENGEIDRAPGDGRIFDVSETVLEIGEAVPLGELSSELNHFRRVIHRDDLARGFGQELRKRSFTRTEIGDRQRRK